MAASRICSIPDCGKRARSHGFCGKHYWRWQKHGDPLAGRTFNGEPMRYLREVVLPYEGTECLIWPFAHNTTGYAQVSSDNRRQLVSRIVCEAAHGAPPTPDHQAAHECGRGTDSCVAKRHIFWKTRLGNKADELVHGTRNRGERQGHAKLTSANVREIRALKGRIRSREIAKRFGVSETTISGIYHGTVWAWLD